MSIPKEPRQIMINLMYLVLTALLALNVSNEILNAFKTLSLSIDKSNRSIDQRNTEVYDAIKENEKAAGQAEKVKPYREKADLVVKEANELVEYMNNWKKKIIMEAGGYDKGGEDSTLPARMDNIDATTLLLVEKKGGDTMKTKINGLRQFLLNQLRPSDTGSISPLMPLKTTNLKPNDHNPTGDWAIGNFEHMPAIAAMALFSKYQNDIRSSEALVLNRLFEEAHMKDIKFDTIAAVAVPTTSYALDGDKIQASILMAAFNKSNKPTVTILGGGGQKKDAVNGVVPWETIAHGAGLQTVRGKISLTTAEQGTIERDWKFEYTVGTTGASMQLDKMNVFYIGVDNPVTVAAAGYSVEDVFLEAPGATITGPGKGHYIINVTQKGDLTVTIKAKKDKQVVTAGTSKIRVKRIPDPIPSLGGFSSGGMAATLFRAQVAPAAVLENFDFDAKFQVVGFTFSMLPRGKDFVGPFTVDNRSGARFRDSKEIEKVQGTAKPGDRIFIESIKAIGPDKQVRTLKSGIILVLNS